MRAKLQRHNSTTAGRAPANQQDVQVNNQVLHTHHNPAMACADMAINA
jgi:hypothetical protein